MNGKAPSESWVEMTELVLPQHTNALGTVFGGVVMSWVDIAAATCAMRHTAKTVVTASIDAMHFLAPIRLGWIVTLKACVNHTSRHSLEVGVRVTSEQPLTKERHHTASAYVTMVALDSHRRPTQVIAVVPETPEEKLRFAAAIHRRHARLTLAEAIKVRHAQDV